LNDLIADVTAVALIQFMSVATNGLAEPTDSSVLPVDVCGNDRVFRIKCFHHMMSQFYSSVKTDLTTGRSAIVLENGSTVVVNDCIELEEHSVADGEDLKSSASLDRLKTTLKRVYLTLFPIPIEYGWCECGQASN
jgi:cleavage and polyadenylation specificity factor subunit 3